MGSDALLKTCPLGSGLTAAVTDTTRHYFGGYFHVRIEVRTVVPLQMDYFATSEEYEDARERLGATVEFSRTMEKMAVPEGELEHVRQHLLDAFDANLLPYLQRDDFAPGFVRSEYRKKLKNVPRFHH